MVSFVCCYCIYYKRKHQDNDSIKLKQGHAIELGGKKHRVPSTTIEPATPLQNILNTHWDNTGITPPQSPIINGHISNYSGDHDNDNDIQPEILRVQTEGDIHDVILNMNATKGKSITYTNDGFNNNISTGVVNEMLDEEDEEEVNKMYFKKSDQLPPRKTEHTMTKTGEKNYNN
eukprot:766119_1